MPFLNLGNLKLKFFFTQYVIQFKIYSSNNSHQIQVDSELSTVDGSGLGFFQRSLFTCLTDDIKSHKQASVPTRSALVRDVKGTSDSHKLHLRVPRAKPYRVSYQRAAIFKTSIQPGTFRYGQLWFRFVLPPL